MRQCFLLLSLLPALLSAQTGGPYRFSWKRDGLLVGTGAALVGSYLPLQGTRQPFADEAEILALDASGINGLDRVALDRWSPAAALRSDVGLYGTFALGTTAALWAPLSRPREGRLGQAGLLLLMWGETNVLTAFGTDLIKVAAYRPRPFVYFVDAPLEEKLVLDARKSFISGHTSTTAANCFIMAKVFNDYFPDSRWRPVVWSAAALIPAYVGWQRVAAGKHFPTDVLAGYAFGAVLGYLVPHWHLPGGHRPLVRRGMSFQLYPITATSGPGLGLQVGF